MVRAHIRTSKQKGIWKKEGVELRLVRRCKVCVVLMVRATEIEPCASGRFQPEVPTMNAQKLILSFAAIGG